MNLAFREPLRHSVSIRQPEKPYAVKPPPDTIRKFASFFMGTILRRQPHFVWAGLRRYRLRDEGCQFFHAPDVIRESSFHRRGHAKSLMDADEVVVHEMQSNSMTVILNLPRESIGEPSKPAHRHAHSKVLAFNVGRGYVLGSKGYR